MNFIIVAATLLTLFTGLAKSNALEGTTLEETRPDSEKLALVKNLVSPWGFVDRWLIEYEAISSLDNSRVIHQTMAVSDPADLYKVTAHTTPSNPWQADPFSAEFFIHGGKTCVRFPFKRAYGETPIKSGTLVAGSTWMDALLTIVPKWPLTEYKLPLIPGLGTSPVLVEAVQSDKFRLLRDTQVLSNECCSIFDYSGIERIWIATNYGLCVMRHDLRDPVSKRLYERILTDKVSQVAPGLWIPTDYRIQIFDTQNNTNADILSRQSRVHILKCLLNNDVPSSTFIPPLQLPGTIKYENGQANHFSQVSPGGEDLLQDMAGFMIECAHLPTIGFPRSHDFEWLFGGMVIGCGAGLILIRINDLPGVKK